MDIFFKFVRKKQHDARFSKSFTESCKSEKERLLEMENMYKSSWPERSEFLYVAKNNYNPSSQYMAHQHRSYQCLYVAEYVHREVSIA